MTKDTHALLATDHQPTATRLMRALSDLPQEVRDRIVVIDTITASDLPPFLGNPAIHPISLSPSTPSHPAPLLSEEHQGPGANALFQHVMDGLRHVPYAQDPSLEGMGRGAPEPKDNRPGHLKGLGSHITSARRAR